MTTKIRKVKHKFGTVHVIAQCQNCEWSGEDYLRTRENAYRHAAKKGHRVNVDVGLTGYYDGREE